MSNKEKANLDEQEPSFGHRLQQDTRSSSNVEQPSHTGKDAGSSPACATTSTATTDNFVKAVKVEVEKAKQRMIAELNDPTKCACNKDGPCLAHESRAGGKDDAQG